MSTPIETNTEELHNILETVNNLPNAGGSGSSDVFVVHVTWDENEGDTYSVDKTFEEITEAAYSGKICLLEENGRCYSLEYCETDELAFCCYGTDFYTIYTFYSDGDTEYDYVISETIYSHAISWLNDDGEVASGIISDEYMLNQLYNSFYKGRIKTSFPVFNTEIYIPIFYEAFADITRIAPGDSEAYYFARVFVKDGYVDISFYEENENEVPVVRWEASFTKMT